MCTLSTGPRTRPSSRRRPIDSPSIYSINQERWTWTHARARVCVLMCVCQMRANTDERAGQSAESARRRPCDLITSESNRFARLKQQSSSLASSSLSTSFVCSAENCIILRSHRQHHGYDALHRVVCCTLIAAAATAPAITANESEAAKRYCRSRPPTNISVLQTKH